ncbi:MAG: hypothetical protein SGCHY_001414 [Lobulomycetales sp.]
MGVRYNANKREAGAYYSTKIWAFHFKCHLCPNWIEIQTDPQNTAYKIISARVKQETWDPEENGGVVLPSAKEKERLETDAFYRLEKTTKDAEVAAIKKDAVEALLEANHRTWSDPYSLNYSLRKRLRSEKRVIAEKTKEADSIRKRTGLSIPLLLESPSDRSESQKVNFASASTDNLNFRRELALQSHIFEKDIAIPKVKVGAGSSLSGETSIIEQNAHRIKASSRGFSSDPFQPASSSSSHQIPLVSHPKSSVKRLVQYESDEES